MNHGFTLIEVLVALVIFAIGVSAVAGSTAMLTRLSGDTWRRTVLVTTAENQFEGARAACPDSTAAGPVVAVIEVPRAGRAPLVDTLATEVACR